MTDRCGRPEHGDNLGPDGRPTEHRWDGATRASMAVVKAVADATGRDTMELPVLAEAVDTDALDALFGVEPDGQRPSLKLSFGYAGVEVRLRRDGRVVVEPRAH